MRKGSAYLAMATMASAVGLGGTTIDGQAGTAGGAVIAGSFSYPDPNGVWFVGPCEPTDWTASFTGGSGALDLPGDESAGVVSIAAAGSSACADVASESGPVSLTFEASGAMGVFRCASMAGYFTRTLTAWSMSVTGDCTLNNTPEPGVHLGVSVTGSPTRIGGDFGNFTSFAAAGFITAS
jgi:hypothetical protein